MSEWFDNPKHNDKHCQHCGVTYASVHICRVSQDLRERLIDTYLKSPEGRSKLAESTFRPAQNLLDAWDTYIKREGSAVSPKDVIQVMDRIHDALDGTETFDKVRFLSLRSDLKSLKR